jgi:hypothetical protein
MARKKLFPQPTVGQSFAGRLSMHLQAVQLPMYQVHFNPKEILPMTNKMFSLSN